MTLPLLPTTVVGSYPQPDWLIDREMLVTHGPPRVRMREIWRVDERFLEAAQDDATRLAIDDMERAGLDIISDGEIRRESYFNRFATALSGIDIDRPGIVKNRSGKETPVPRVTGKVKRLRPVEKRDVEFLRRPPGSFLGHGRVMHRSPLTKRVLVLAFPDAQMLDIAGPIEVFTRVVRLLDDRGYAVELITSGKAVSTTSGLSFQPARRLSDLKEREIDDVDMLVVAGGAGVFDACEDEALIDFVRRASEKVARIASICTGSFILARAGLLDGRRAATHWSYVSSFKERFPQVSLEEDAIYVRDGEIWTSAGVTAGIDLALGIVRADFGKDVAMTIARALVMFMVRPGGQAQFSSHLTASQGEGGKTARAVGRILDDLAGDLSIPALAALQGMSERTFTRAFRAELGVTPAVFVERARVDAARRLLESDRAALAKTIAGACGFRDEETMRRAFVRQMNVTPSQYRARFS